MCFFIFLNWIFFFFFFFFFSKNSDKQVAISTYKSYSNKKAVALETTDFDNLVMRIRNVFTSELLEYSTE